MTAARSAARGDRRDGYARTGTTSVRTMAAASTARTVAMIGTARATSSISATGPDTVATMISAAAGTMRAVISNGPIPAISSVRASLAAMNAATRITASPMTSAPMTAAGSPCATPVRAKGGKRIHRKNENRIVRDERSEGAKRHERRMIAKYGNTEGPNRRHSKKNRHNAPFRMKSGRR